MKGINDIRQENARQIINDSFDGSQSKLALALEIKEPSFISRLLSDNPNTRKNIGHKLARKIEAAGGKPNLWLDQPHHEHLHQRSAQYAVESAGSFQRVVPVISWVQAGTWQEVEDPHQPGLAEEWIPSPVRCSPSSFVLYVRGGSMEPRFRDGEMIIVDPDAEARHKSFVVVRLDDSKEATFKQLVIAGQRRYLQPLNPQWPEPIIEINGNATICGVVVFKGEKI